MSAGDDKRWTEIAKFTTNARRDAEKAISLAIEACSKNATAAQLSDLADAVDALTDGVLNAALTLARAATTPHPKAEGALRPTKHQQTIEEIREAFAEYRATRAHAPDSAR